MSTFTIPRKEIGEPSPAYLKEVTTSRSFESTWDVDVPEEAQREKKRKFFGAGTGAGWVLSDRFDRILPPNKRYIGRSRRTLLIIILVAFLCLLALIIGLAVGLSGGSKKYDILCVIQKQMLTNHSGRDSSLFRTVPRLILGTLHTMIRVLARAVLTRGTTMR